MSKEGILSLSHKKITLPFILSFTFFCLGLIAILRHGMWLDELQAWTIARDNVSLLSLLTAIKYDGHPALWYILLYAITRFTHNPVSMQILHLCIAALNIFIFTKFSPFSRWQKIILSQKQKTDFPLSCYTNILIIQNYFLQRFWSIMPF